MVLHVLPTRTGGAAENMATDFLLLQRYAESAVPRFRHYGWHRPAFTFGYGQKIAFVREQVAACAGGSEHACEICRRPTGGGVVDHRDDWTYAVVIPRGHPMEERRATESYRAVHATLAEAMRAQAVDAVLKPCELDCSERNSATRAPVPAQAGVCFASAEAFDVIEARTGAKIAGAAQKRNKHGLLLQGSIWRPAIAVPEFDWDAFSAEFIARLAGALRADAAEVAWPEFNEDELAGLTETYGSAEWVEYR